MKACTSVPQIADCFTWTSTWPARGSGVSISATSKRRAPR